MRKFPLFIGTVMFITVYLSFLLIFLTAYASPYKSVVVTIDQYSEANIEIIMLLASLPFVLFTAWTILGYIAHGGKI